MLRSIKFALAAAGLSLATFSSAAQAAPVYTPDTYWGGNITGGSDTDTYGGYPFIITGATVDRVGVGGNDLSVVITTDYSGLNVGRLATNLGALFIGDPSKLQLNDGVTAGNTGVAPYKEDIFTLDTDRFSYVFDFNTTPNTTSNGTTADQGGGGTLYSLVGDGSDVVLSNPGGGSIRNGQAVDITEAAKLSAGTGITGTWSTSTGNVTFLISNFFGGSLPGVYQTGLTLAWAMTCANDVMVWQVAVPGRAAVPIPAGIILLLSGIVGLGFLGRFKAKSSGSPA